MRKPRTGKQRLSGKLIRFSSILEGLTSWNARVPQESRSRRLHRRQRPRLLHEGDLSLLNWEAVGFYILIRIVALMIRSRTLSWLVVLVLGPVGAFASTNQLLASPFSSLGGKQEEDPVANDHPVPDSELWLTYAGQDGPGKGKHIVLIAAEQEYRSEQSMPMLARLLSQRHGFDCTVLFCVNEQGEVDPTQPAPFEDKSKLHRIPGLKYLQTADCVIWLSRFMQLTDEDKQHFHDYFDSGKPLIALRTANHGFWGGAPYQKDGTNVSLRDLLGGTFKGHHGGWHREATRGIIVEKNHEHPILTGVDDIWGTSDVYRCHDDNYPFPDDCTALVLGQPLVNLEPDAPANKDKEPLPVAWVKTWTGNHGKASRIFHFTMGSAEDFANAGVRRLTINAVYWGLGMEDALTPELSVDIVGDYQPLPAGFNYEKLGVEPHKPAFYR